MERTWRSLSADAMTKSSVIAKTSETSMTAMLLADFSSAACAANSAIRRAASVILTNILYIFDRYSRFQHYSALQRFTFTRAIQVIFRNILHYPVWHQVPHWFHTPRALTAVC